MENIVDSLAIENDAHRQLGSKTFDGTELSRDTYTLFHTYPKRRSGTKAYAQEVLVSLRAFQEKWKEQLKATKV